MKKAERILQTADTFHRAAYEIVDLIFPEDDKSIEGIRPEYNIPLIVNECFAIELYFKAILQYCNVEYETRGAKGHLLKTLYKQLPDKIQSEIKTLAETDMSDEQFDEILLSCDNAFSQWRYYFDDRNKGMAIDMLLLGRFAGAVAQVAEDFVKNKNDYEISEKI